MVVTIDGIPPLLSSFITITIMIGNRRSVCLPCCTLRVNLADAIPGEAVSLEWEDVTCEVATKNGEKIILDNVNGQALPGRLMAIMASRCSELHGRYLSMHLGHLVHRWHDWSCVFVFSF